MNQDPNQNYNNQNGYPPPQAPPPYPPHPPYPPPVKYSDPAVDKLMSVKDWLITLLILCIPVANIVMLFVWGFSNDNLTRRNYSRAYLIFMGIVIVFVTIFMAIMMAAVFSSGITRGYRYGIY